MSKQRIEIEVDIPEGYEATGEYRVPEGGEYYAIHVGGGVSGVGSSMHRLLLDARYLIIRRKKPLAIQVCCDIIGCTFNSDVARVQHNAKQAIAEWEAGK